VDSEVRMMSRSRCALSINLAMLRDLPRGERGGVL
jgi:hypothetical protein